MEEQEYRNLVNMMKSADINDLNMAFAIIFNIIDETKESNDKPVNFARIKGIINSVENSEAHKLYADSYYTLSK